MITIAYAKLVPRISNEDKQTISDKKHVTHLALQGICDLNETHDWRL